MNDILVVWISLAVAAAGGFAGMSLFIGLWLGERKRGDALENMLRFGSPRVEGAKVVPAPLDTEERVFQFDRQLRDEVMDTASAMVQEIAKSKGFTVTPEDARKEAQRLSEALWAEGAAE